MISSTHGSHDAMLNRALINEDRRLRETMDLSGSAVVQWTSRVSSHNTGIHAINCVIQSPSASDHELAPLDHFRASPGASTPRACEHHKIQRPSPCRSCIGPSSLPHPADHRSSSANSSSYFSFKCVVVNRSRTLEVSRICTHESFECALRDLHNLPWIEQIWNSSLQHLFFFCSFFFFFGSKWIGQRDPND